ncbi:MAG: bifunctional tRNA (5-methylaminomethyl-2-thiouridine)(34)-methyltransferase MnmD/FAD-dependent 5-carboxymethylaminomethyl-2-thiouridine(34) oxidoreductase MnmC [Rhodocyclaceae bacterium]
MPLQPATLAFAPDGTPYSAAYDDLYHTAAGGLAQARQVFLAGNDLPGRWCGQDRFVILETGFGQGLNFLATWQAWRAAPGRPRRLHFLSVEKHPFTATDLALLHAATPELAELSARLRAAWPPLTPGFHRLEFVDPGYGTVLLTLAFADAIAAVPQFVGEAQAIYLDGFSPAKNPDLWSPQLLREIGLMAAPDATVATWSVAGSVRNALSDAGFCVEKGPRFGFKRNTLSGRRTGVAETAPDNESHAERHAIVIGAGLAGCLASERLAARGWRVDLIERHADVAQETSGNLTAAMLPVLSLDDNRMSRLNRACYLYGLHQLAEWSRQADTGIDWSACGVLQIARDDAHAEKQREILARNAFPPDFARFVDAGEGATLAGLPVGGPGWWFAGGAWVNPASLCRAALARAGDQLDAQFNCRVERIAYDGRHWTVYDSAGKALASAPQLILAGATDIIALPQAAHLPLFRFRGQVSHLPAPADAGLRSVVCREGYATPAYRGIHCAGASFQRGSACADDSALRDADHTANLERLQRMLPGYCADAAPETIGGRVGFRPVSPDKLPIVGQLYHPDARPQGRDFSAVERWPGLHVASGYGARGLVWSMLMAELLASQLEGEPLPLESELAATVDPARFLLRRKSEPPAAGE